MHMTCLFEINKIEIYLHLYLTDTQIHRLSDELVLQIQLCYLGRVCIFVGNITECLDCGFDVALGNNLQTGSNIFPRNL